MNQVIIVSGPAGAGKTSVAGALCERFDRMLHIEVDTLRHWVRAGYRHPWAGDHQAAEQRLLATRNACAVARESVAMRYAVVIDDVVTPEEALRYRSTLEGVPTYVHLVTLLPSLDVTLSRDAGRSAAIPDRARALHEEFSAAIAGRLLPGAVLDTSTDEDEWLTADRVIDVVARGDALLLEPRVPASDTRGG